MSEINWNECMIYDNIDDMIVDWTEKVVNCAKLFIPNKEVTIRPRDKPWYTNSLRNMKRKVMRLYENAKKHNNNASWERYNISNLKYCEEVKASKDQYESHRNQRLKDTCSKSAKTWWRTVKEVLGFSKDSSISCLKDGENILTHTTDKVELLNRSFSAFSTVETSHGILPPVVRPQHRTLCKVTVSEKETLEMIRSLNPNKAMGPDEISPRLLKKCGHELAPSLTKLFNLSLEKGQFPALWKIANVIPLYKKGDPSDANNYRPVSLLSCVGKVFERIIFKNVFNYFREHLLVSIHQSGFQPGDSTVNQLVYLYNTFAKALYIFL